MRFVELFPVLDVNLGPLLHGLGEEAPVHQQLPSQPPQQRREAEDGGVAGEEVEREAGEEAAEDGDEAGEVLGVEQVQQLIILATETEINK